MLNAIWSQGRTFSSIIKNFVKEYSNLRDFEREYKTKRGWTAYEQTLTNMKRRYPYYVKEIQGIADGSGVSFQQVRTPTQSTYMKRFTRRLIFLLDDGLHLNPT